jgi:hypothetical protein
MSTSFASRIPLSNPILSRGNEDDDGMVAANVPPVATCAGDALGTEAFASALAAAATGDSALVPMRQSLASQLPAFSHTKASAQSGLLR